MPILALHGFTGCGADFAPLAKLCGGEWHCPDLPGHGSNPQLDCSPDAMVDFINQSLPTPHSPLSTSSNILLGYSMGARAALLHAVQHPDQWDALILISGNPGIEVETERAKRRTTDAELADSIERLGMQKFLGFWQETPLIRSQKKIPANLLSAMQTNRLKNTTGGLAKSLQQFGQGSVPNLWPEIDKLRIPICLITGERDTKYTEISRRLLPTLHSQLSTHTVIDGASHMPHLEQAEESAENVRSFIESLA